MAILLIIKGFVTNSSSANYWLDDEMLEENEIASISQNQKILNEKNIAIDNRNVKFNQKTNNTANKETQQGQIIQINNIVKDNVTDFFIWLVFSLIFVLVIILKKIKFKKNK